MQLLPRPQAPLITSFSGGDETSNRLGVGNKSVGNKNFKILSMPHLSKKKRKKNKKSQEPIFNHGQMNT